MTRVVEYSGWLGNNNIGDEALYLANKDLFSDFELVNSEYYDDSDVVLYGGGTIMPRHSTRHPTKELVAAIGVGVEDPDFRNQRFAPVDIDYYLSKNGLEYFLENKYTRHALRQFASISDSIMFHRKYIKNSRFEPLRYFDHLGVRGPHSKEILERYGIESKVVGDTALRLEPSDYNHGSVNRVAVTLRSEIEVLKWSNDTDYIDIVKEFCQSLSEEYEFVFLPFRPVDIPLHIEMAESIDDSKFKDYCTHTDVQAIIDEFAKCDLVIGERLHASILSACSFTPFLSLGYQPKNEDFVNSVEMNEYHIRINRLTREWLDDRFEKLVTTDEARVNLEKEVEDKRSALNSFSMNIIDDINEIDSFKEKG